MFDRQGLLLPTINDDESQSDGSSVASADGGWQCSWPFRRHPRSFDEGSLATPRNAEHLIRNAVRDPRHAWQHKTLQWPFLVHAYFSELLIFLALQLVCYIGYRKLVENVDFDCEPKTYVDHYSSVMVMLFLGAVLYVFGNYSTRIDGWFVGPMVACLFVFGWVSNVPFLSTSLARWQYWHIDTWLVMVALIVVMALAIGYHIGLAYQRRVMLVFCAALAFPVALIFLALAACEWDDQTSENFHLHHWSIYYCIAYFTRFRTRMSKVCAGAAVGIFLEGIIAYRLAPPFFATLR
eukprot:TRINITY_DN7182_c0_g1_i1.p2 TRINITY_DN7182_c0_g1~~TRINITY_DN7182_c0_g1_i1.p2  ORF type:complete len:294 (-),score=68.14 TRINITY_DN7182_c0_g1_i1:466-1347(-)